MSESHRSDIRTTTDFAIGGATESGEVPYRSRMPTPLVVRTFAPMSRFLFASTPIAAHSATPRPIVRSLVERGHEVVWYAGRAYADRIRATGARYEPLVEALDFSMGNPYDWFPHLRDLDGIRAIKAGFRDLLLNQIPAQVEDIERILSAFPADAVVNDLLLGRTTNVVDERGGPVNAVVSDTALSPPYPDFPPWGRGLAPVGRPVQPAAEPPPAGTGTLHVP